MPKIIENVRGMLIEEAQTQITANGYDNVTIRSIAKGCGLGLGTFYNYFKSKEMLIATFLNEDWQKRMSVIKENHKDETNPMVVVRTLYDNMTDFIKIYNNIFTSPSAIKTFSFAAPGYHKYVREQVAMPIYNSCVLAGIENAEFLSIFVAESLVTWTVAKRDFEEIAAIISKLFVQ